MIFCILPAVWFDMKNNIRYKDIIYSIMSSKELRNCASGIDEHWIKIIKELCIWNQWTLDHGSACAED